MIIIGSRFERKKGESIEDYKERLALENMNLVYYVANMFESKDVSNEDIVGAANIGFVKALNSYEFGKGVSFTTYAVKCIKNEILLMLKKEQKNSKYNISLNSVLSEDKNGNSLELEEVTVVDENLTNQPDEEALKKEMELYLYDIIDELDAKDKFILVYRYGLYDQEKMTQEEIAEILNLSQASISKKESNIMYALLGKIRKDKK